MNKNKERQFWTEFLEMYKSLPALWCVKSPDYCNRLLKSDAYEKLVEKLQEIDPNADRDCVVRKINNFRSSYRRDMNRKKKSEQSGAEVFLSSLWYFDLLHFLHDPEEMAIIMDENKRHNLEEVVQNPKPSTSKRKWSFNEEERSPKMACDYLNETDNDAAILAKGWATQFSELSSQQKVFARKLFSDVLFCGCLGKLNEYVVLGIHRFLETTCAP